MSACLFTVTRKFFEKSSVEKIREAMILWKDVLYRFEHDSTLHDNKFEADRYYGFLDNYAMGLAFLSGYEKGVLDTEEKK